MSNDWTGVARRSPCRKGMVLSSMLIVAFSLALDPLGIARPAGAGEVTLNPHSDFIFKATGTQSCRDCHAHGYWTILLRVD